MKKHIPNLITAFRLILVPVFIWMFFSGDIRVAFAVFLLASASDLLDGYLARKWNVVSQFGKLFDPIADKAMQISAIVCLTIKGMTPLIPVIIVFVKELIMLVGGLLILKKLNYTVYSNVFGKFASFFFNLIVCLCFFRDFWFITPTAQSILDILVWVAVALSVCALFQYAYCNALKPMRQLKNKNDEKEE